MDIHHCPRCELRFVNTSELRSHFEVDHAADPTVFERYRYRSPERTRPTRTILLVANQTLEREGLVEDVAGRTAGGERLIVLVPATHSGHHEQPRAAEPTHEGATDETGLALARWRLRTTVDRLRAAGVDAVGEVGSADPYTAVCKVLSDENVDEILLSTLPPSSSRWLNVDLPGRLRRHTGRPVTVLPPATVPSTAS